MRFVTCLYLGNCCWSEFITTIGSPDILTATPSTFTCHVIHVFLVRTKE